MDAGGKRNRPQPSVGRAAQVRPAITLGALYMIEEQIGTLHGTVNGVSQCPVFSYGCKKLGGGWATAKLRSRRRIRDNSGGGCAPGGKGC